MPILSFFSDDASSPSLEEFNDPCLAEFPTASLLRSTAAAVSHSLWLSFLISTYFMATFSDLVHKEQS